uniref:CID domain-containing protein n=1 Tax=Zea mays TaxID=4577 RepID=A0A804NZX1_MAIZE
GETDPDRSGTGAQQKGEGEESRPHPRTAPHRAAPFREGEEGTRGGRRSRQTAAEGRSPVPSPAAPSIQVISSSHREAEKISKPEDWKRKPTPKKFFVCFYGTGEIAFVPLADLEEFTEKKKNDLLDRALKVQRKYVQQFNVAVEQICKAYNELPKTSEAANVALPDQSEKTTEHLVRSPDIGGTPGLGQMEDDPPTDCSSTSGQGSGTEEDVKDGGHEIGDNSLAVPQKKASLQQDPKHPKTKKSAASKSGFDMYTEQEHSPTSLRAERQIEEVKIEEESCHLEGFVLEPNLEVVCALEVPKNFKSNKLLRNAESKENEHVGVGSPTGRIAVEAASDVVLNMSAEEESREFKKSKIMTKQSLTTGSEKRDNKIVHGKPDKQLTGKSSAGFSLNQKSLTGSGQHKMDSSADTRPAKKARLMDRAGETDKTVAKSETKLNINYENHNAVKHEQSTAVETCKNTILKTGIGDDRARKSGGAVSPISKLHSEIMEPASGSSVTQSTVADSLKKGSSRKEDVSRVDRKLVKPKRRACRFDDDEDEGQQTPLHRTSAKSLSTHIVPTEKPGSRGNFASHVGNASGKKPGPAREEKSRSVRMSPVKHEPVFSSPSQDKVHARHQLMGRNLITGSVETPVIGNKMSLVDGKSSAQVKMPACSEVKKLHSTSKPLQVTSGKSHSRNYPASEKIALVPKSEETKAKSKPATSVEHKVATTLSTERTGKRDHLKEERSSSVDKAAYSEPNPDSAKSIKHLIAAAQARRNLMASALAKFDGSSTDNSAITSTSYAIARDALEGMIETLSRTKDSIGRATRHAIECSKYGIAGEIVELLIQKLENEHNLHRRIDLLFLVDSITQCSHSHRGVAGASYVPTVQAALPRLFGAAAPPGAGARENRRQCLKVLDIITDSDFSFSKQWVTWLPGFVGFKIVA